ncbi:hypothetical protein ACHAWF_004056 [Thalassiosira exigua]
MQARAAGQSYAADPRFSCHPALLNLHRGRTKSRDLGETVGSCVGGGRDRPSLHSSSRRSISTGRRTVPGAGLSASIEGADPGGAQIGPRSTRLRTPLDLHREANRTGRRPRGAASASSSDLRCEGPRDFRAPRCRSRTSCPTSPFLSLGGAVAGARQRAASEICGVAYSDESSRGVGRTHETASTGTAKRPSGRDRRQGPRERRSLSPFGRSDAPSALPEAMPTRTLVAASK